jgi:hypothetical protein
MLPMPPIALFIFDIILVFILIQDFAVLRAAIAEKRPFYVLIQIIRLAFFTACLLVVLVFGYLNSLVVMAGLIAVMLIEATVILILLPRIGRSIQGALGEALAGGAVTLFGVGTVVFSASRRDYEGLLAGLAITGLGGWMLYAAVKKMSQGE